MLEASPPQSSKAARRRKRRGLRYFRRAVLLLLLGYLLLAILPYAFPPSGEPLPADWLESASSDTGVDSATILEAGQEALEARLRLIRQATESIRLGSYIYALDESGSLVTAALLDAADRGVQVRIIIDGLIGMVNLKNAPGAYALGSHENVELRYYNPVQLLDPIGLNARYHEKFFVVDDQWLILGGRNVADEFLSQEGNPKYNYDQDILLHHDRDGYGACQQVADYFDSLWDSGLCSPRYQQVPGYLAASVAQAREDLARLWQEALSQRDLSPLSADQLIPVEKTVLISGDVSPRPKSPAVYDRLLDLMSRAESRVILQSPYFVMDASMLEGLTAVCDLPTDMVLLTNSAATGNNIIASADGVFHRADANGLNAQVLEVQADYSMHTKSILIDDNISVFGSFNVDPRSAYIDTELMLAVYSPELNALLEANMLTLLNQAVPVSAQAQEAWPALQPQSPSLGKSLAIYLLSPLITLFRFLV